MTSRRIRYLSIVKDQGRTTLFSVDSDDYPSRAIAGDGSGRHQ
jgi:hypothetical protein